MMAMLLSRPVLIAIAMLAFIGAVVGLYRMGYADGRDDTQAAWLAKWNEQAAILAEAKAKALEVARDEEQRRQSAIEQVRQDAEQQIARAEADATAAADAADGLREQARRLAARASQCSSNPSPTQGSKATAKPTAVLAELLGEMEAAGRAMAKEADRRGIAGAACEVAYQSLVAK